MIWSKMGHYLNVPNQVTWFATACLQLLSKSVGISSGPGEAFGFISSIASIMSASLKEMLESEKGCCTGGILNSADARFVSKGLLKTDVNWSWRLLAIS